MGKYTNPLVKTKVVELLQQGLTYNEVLNLYPEIKSKTTLNRWCNEYNISYEYVSERKHDYNKIIELLKSGVPPVKVCKILNIPKGTIKDIYFKFGISFTKSQGNTRYFQNIDSPQKAYILGFIAADGYIVQSNPSSITLGIQINKPDIEVLEFIKQEIGFEKDITFPNDSMCRITLSNKELVQDLFNLGITQRKSKTLTNILPKIPKHFHKDFISGYLDGDGCIVVNKNPNITTILVSFRGTKEFLQGFIDTMELTNYYFHFNKTWILSFAKKEEVYKFYTLYSSSCFNLSRKINKFNKGIEKLILKYPEVQTISSPLLLYKE